MEEVTKKVLGYQARAPVLLRNGMELVQKGEMEKGGEFIWGAVGAYLNALELLKTGKAKADHGQMVKNAEGVANSLGDKRLDEAIKSAEKLHANYYHSFLTKEEFLERAERARYAYERFGKILEDELSRLGITKNSAT